MADTPNDKPESLEQSKRQHRRDVMRQIWLPVYGGLVVLLAVMVGVLLLPRMVSEPVHIATLSNIMVTLFFLLPQVICLLALYVIVVVLAFGLHGFHGASQSQLQRLHHFSRTVTDKTIEVTDNINEQTTKLRVKIAAYEGAMDTTFQSTESSQSENVTDDERTDE